MPEHRKKRKLWRRILKGSLAAVALGLVGLIAWITLAPTLSAEAVTTYESYPVQTGDIMTENSFSASLSVKKSETFSSAEPCTVREIYVQSGDAVKTGDPLILLSTGELFSASFDGAVNEIRVKSGDWLWPNFQVVQVCDLEHLEVSMNVDEYDVENLSVGQACTVSVISLGQDFETSIAHINRVSRSQGTVAFYAVTCDLTVPATVLPGMQATVTLPAVQATGVTTVSMAAIAYDGSKQPYVLLKEADGTYRSQNVELGLSDGMTVEVKSGLTAGQTVYAVSGTQSAKTLTLADIYTALVGQKTVVNDMSSQGDGMMQGMPDGQMRQGEAGGAPQTDDQQTATGDQPNGQTQTDALNAAEGATQAGQATVAPDAAADTTASGATATPAATATVAPDATSGATASEGAGHAPPNGGSPPERPNTQATTTVEEATDHAQ